MPTSISRPKLRSSTAAALESHIDDPIRMYLMQMGEIPMLTRELEISSAKAIEKTRTHFRRTLLGNDFVLQGAVELLEKVQSGELRLDRTIEISVTNTAEKKRTSSGSLPNLAHDQAPVAAQSGRFPHWPSARPATTPKSGTLGGGSLSAATRSSGSSRS